MAKNVGECSSYKHCTCIRPSEEKYKTSGQTVIIHCFSCQLVGFQLVLIGLAAALLLRIIQSFLVIKAMAGIACVCLSEKQ